MSKRPSIWCDKSLQWLRDTHPTGMSMRDMGLALTEAMGDGRVWTKNSIVGMSHKLELAPRDPCVPDRVYPNGNRPRVPNRPPVVPHATPQEITPMASKRRSPSPHLTLVPKPAAAVTPCQFPFGHPRQAGFRFCEQPTWSCTDPDKSRVYCRTHHELCYMRRVA